jgi:hypothetical protein
MTAAVPLMSSDGNGSYIGGGNGNSHTTSGGGGAGGDSGGGGGDGGGAASPGPQFAESDRTLEPLATGNVPQAPAGPQHVEPDLNVLAHQVYTILRRRLAAERRRF